VSAPRLIRRRRALAGPLAAVLLSAALAACGGRGGAAGKGGPETVGIVLSTGGRGDKGFNDAAIAGAARAARELGADTAIADSRADEANPQALAAFAQGGRELVIGISFLASKPAFDLAKQHPATDFAVLDYSPVTDQQGRALPPPPNLAGVTYRSEEGAYLAGALAGLKTTTRRVGFVGGMYAPVIRQFEAGYTAGVREVCPDCTVVVDYAGTTPAAFNDPARGKALAQAQFASGADAVFHASGGTGAGVFQAAREAPPGRWVIGVDVDQSAEAPGRVLTSVTKNLDVSVFGLIRDAKAGTFRGGLISQGLADGAVGYIYDERNRPLVPDSVYYRVETLRQAIVAGLIKVPKVPVRRGTAR
jgi:basic membrane protein A